MEAVTDDLSTWLLEQIAEVERIAREADAAAHWAFYLEGYAIESDAGDWFIEPKILARHLALHDPKRALAECGRQRRLVERYRRAVAATPSAVSSYVRGQDDGYREACLDAIRDAAAAFADRPGYREEWALDTPSDHPVVD